MIPPPWPARRVGDRVLCGRQDAHSGRYICQGEIGHIVPDPLRRYASGELVGLPLGMKRASLGSTHWVPSARNKRGGSLRTTRIPETEWHPVITYPWTRACPDCDVASIVMLDVLSSDSD